MQRRSMQAHHHMAITAAAVCRLAAFAVLLSALPNAAEGQLRPALGTTIGWHINQRVEWQPHFSGTSARRAEQNHAPITGVVLGLDLSPAWTAELSARTSLGAGRPFRAVELGMAARANAWSTPHVRVAAVAMRPYNPLLCVAGSRCTVIYRAASWKPGVDLRVGMEGRFTQHWAVGPVLWFTRTLQSEPEYRSLGLAVSWMWRRRALHH